MSVSIPIACSRPFAAALALACAAMCLPGCGGKPQTFAKTFDVGGYRLFLECRGRGKPTVILEAGLGGGDEEAWTRIERPARRITRVCEYDRAGLGRSEPRSGASAASVRRVARELHRLLQAAGVDPPYVYVGHSIGGIYALAYSAAYPDEVAGAVYVDSTDPFYTTGILPDGAGAVDYGPPDPSLLHVRLGSRPAIYLAAHNSGTGYLRGATNASLVEAVGSGHSIQDDRPKLVLEAIREVVDAARKDMPLPPCRHSALVRDGGRCLPR
jgi:pimeloyl-ACP methyl ester carboxylesterase